MNAPKILYPTDFSTMGQTALEMATSLARDRGAKLLIVHVEEPTTAYGGGELYYGIEQVGWDGLSKPRSMYYRGFREAPQLPQINELQEVNDAIAGGCRLEFKPEEFKV